MLIKQSREDRLSHLLAFNIMVALVHDSLRVSLRLCPDRNKETQDIEINDGISVMEDGKTVSFFTAKKQTTFNFTHTFDQVS